MSGTHKLIFLLAASSGVISNGQFLKPTVLKSFSSSWMSSSSWVPGRDGQMHEQVQEVRSETFSDHGMAVKHTESKTACRDGLCQHTVSIEKPGSLTVIQQGPAARGWGESVRLPARLRAMMQGFSFPVVYVEERAVPASAHFLAPRPPPTVAEAAAPLPRAGHLPGPLAAAPLAALAGACASLLALLAASVAKCLRSAEAREVSGLGEPLAPGQEAAAPQRARRPAAAPEVPAAPKVAAAPEPAPVGAYLARTYARALAAAESAAAKAYIGRVYARALA